MADIKRFEINIPQAQLDNLAEKLKEVALPDELEDSGWTRGAPLQDVQRLLRHWTSKYDWRKTEAKLNELPQFTTRVAVEDFGELDIHFVYQRSPIASALPLLFVHGWPGSFIEVSKLLPLLAQGDGVNTPAFHVVAPSLPNFGFSEGVKQKGFDLAKYAECLKNLMLKLGFDSFATQGGDWGYMITRTLALLFPRHVKACHINLARPAGPPTFLRNPILALQHRFSPYTELDNAGFTRSYVCNTPDRDDADFLRAWFAKEGYGYNKLQSTKPQTLGYGLADSPAFLLAWIYEKLRDWTHDYPWTDDEVLDWISIYQFSRAGAAASVRIYYEAAHPTNGIGRDRAGQYIPHVPLGIARFPRELDGRPRTWNALMAPKVYQSDNSHGGHFAAWEHPEVLRDDLYAMFKPGGLAHNVVPGQSGFQRAIAKL